MNALDPTQLQIWFETQKFPVGLIVFILAALFLWKRIPELVKVTVFFFLFLGIVYVFSQKVSS